MFQIGPCLPELRQTAFIFVGEPAMRQRDRIVLAPRGDLALALRALSVIAVIVPEDHDGLHRPPGSPNAEVTP